MVYIKYVAFVFLEWTAAAVETDINDHCFKRFDILAHETLQKHHEKIWHSIGCKWLKIIVFYHLASFIAHLYWVDIFWIKKHQNKTLKSKITPCCNLKKFMFFAWISERYSIGLLYKKNNSVILELLYKCQNLSNCKFLNRNNQNRGKKE